MFPFLGFAAARLSIACVLVHVTWTGVFLLVLSVGLDRYCLNLVLSQNILFSPYMVIESFAGYCNLGWHLWSLSLCRRPVQDLLTFIVSIKKSGVILIGLPLYVTSPFSFVALNIFSLFCMF